MCVSTPKGVPAEERLVTVSQVLAPRPSPVSSRGRQHGQARARRGWGGGPGLLWSGSPETPDLSPSAAGSSLSVPVVVELKAPIAEVPS